MCWEASHGYPRDPATPQRARIFCADTLRSALGAAFDTHVDLRNLIDDTQLVVSELVTNAMNASASVTQLHLILHHNRLTVRLDDDATGAPQLRNPDDTDEHGRGLAIVAAVAQKWGVLPTPTGKQVWAELAVSPDYTAELVCDQLP